MFGLTSYELEKYDVLLKKNIDFLFTENEIFSILNLITSKDLVSCDIEKIELFFSKLKSELEDDYAWETLIIDFCNLYSIDIDTIIPAFKKTRIFNEIKKRRGKKKNKAFVSLFI